MDTGRHELPQLFQQLGLGAEPAAIDEFLAQHRLEHGVEVADAPFWNAAQADFLRQALESDAEWAEAVDELAMLLSQ